MNKNSDGLLLVSVDKPMFIEPINIHKLDCKLKTRRLMPSSEWESNSQNSWDKKYVWQRITVEWRHKWCVLIIFNNSIESITGHNPSFNADIWSLGITMIELADGAFRDCLLCLLIFVFVTILGGSPTLIIGINHNIRANRWVSSWRNACPTCHGSHCQVNKPDFLLKIKFTPLLLRALCCVVLFCLFVLFICFVYLFCLFVLFICFVYLFCLFVLCYFVYLCCLFVLFVLFVCFVCLLCLFEQISTTSTSRWNNLDPRICRVCEFF